MKIRLSHVTTALITVLLVAVGMVSGFHYGTTGVFPFGLRSEFVGKQLTATLPKTSQRSALDRISGQTAPNASSDVDFSIFWQTWQLLEKEYVDPAKLDPTKMVDGAVAGMVSAIGDPYTAYLPKTDNERSGEDLAGSFYGIGVELGYVDKTLAVVAPLKDSPAAKAGVQASDLILHVKDETKNLDSDTIDWSLNEAVDNIRGERNVPVILTLLRRSQESPKPFEVSIPREEIVIESVEVEFIEHANKRVAHITLSRFGERTLAEWNAVVEKITTEKGKVDGLVLDLRNNPGGFFDRSVEVASDFIPSGTVVTQTSRFQSQAFEARGAARLQKYPLVVLVNKGSASASEIVAGALRDRSGAKLVGTKTFGKGTVQDRRELPNGAGVHITIARWLLPKGDWIHEAGIPVDVEVEDNVDTTEDEMLFKAIESL